jgi:hypothetical protein
VIRLGGRRSRRAILHGVRPFIPWALLVNCRPASAALRQKRKFAAKPSSCSVLARQYIIGGDELTRLQLI